MGVFIRNQKNAWNKLWRGIGIIFLIYGIILIIGASTGNENPFEPMENMLHHQDTISTQFTPIKSLDDLNQFLKENSGKPTLLDFYADWCVSCKEMDEFTFQNPSVASSLKGFNLLQANVTKNDDIDIRLEKNFNVVAPPTLLFFNAQGQWLPQCTIVGEIGPKSLIKHLQACRTGILGE